MARQAFDNGTSAQCLGRILAMLADEEAFTFPSSI
jgi:hypothetical protein